MEFAIKVTPDTVEWVEAVHGDTVPLTNGLTLYFVGSTDATFLNLILPEQIFEATFDYVGVEDREAFCWVRQHEPVGPNPPTMGELGVDDQWRDLVAVPAGDVKQHDCFNLAGNDYKVCESSTNQLGEKVIRFIPTDGPFYSVRTMILPRETPMLIWQTLKNKS